MLRSLIMFAGALALCSSVFAQNTAPFIGKWTGLYKTEEGAERAAELVITPDGGTWQSHPTDGTGKNNPCFRRAFPIFIQTGSPTELTISTNSFLVVPGCPSLKADLTLVDPTRLEGKLRTGRSISLVKQ